MFYISSPIYSRRDLKIGCHPHHTTPPLPSLVTSSCPHSVSNIGTCVLSGPQIRSSIHPEYGQMHAHSALRLPIGLLANI